MAGYPYGPQNSNYVAPQPSYAPSFNSYNNAPQYAQQVPTPSAPTQNYSPYINQMALNDRRIQDIVSANPHLVNNMGNYQVPMQPNFQAQNQISPLRARPVTGYAEAEASPIEFDTIPNLFTDLPNGKIYVKQYQPDGRASLFTYSLEQNVSQNPQIKQDVQQIPQQVQQELPDYSQEITALTNRIQNLEQTIRTYEGVFLNAGIQSNANVSDDGSTGVVSSNADISNVSGKSKPNATVNAGGAKKP